MKTCKNCKKQIPNNAKTCKYCKKPVKSQVSFQRKKTVVKEETIKIKTSPKGSKKNHYTRIMEEGKKRFEEEKQKRVKQQQKKAQKAAMNEPAEKKSLNIPIKIKKSKESKVPEKPNKQNLKKDLKKKILTYKDTETVKKSKVESKKEFNDHFQSEEVGKKEFEKKEEIASKPTKIKRKSIPMKKKIILGVLVVLSFFFLFCGIKWIQKLTNTEPTTKITTKNYGKVFKMNEKVEYEGIKYQVVNVERSSGTAYKTPKKGYEFIVVTLKLENNTNEKQKYSNKSWRLTNSKGEETSKIFIPIKDHSTLYSGSLVIGAQKTGSLVFEQPKEDPNLQLNFYKIEEIEQQETLEKDEKLEKVFAFKIKVNTNKEAEMKR